MQTCLFQRFRTVMGFSLVLVFYSSLLQPTSLSLLSPGLTFEARVSAIVGEEPPPVASVQAVLFEGYLWLAALARS